MEQIGGQQLFVVFPALMLCVTLGNSISEQQFKDYLFFGSYYNISVVISVVFFQIP
jgi:hypothetical protein